MLLFNYWKCGQAWYKCGQQVGQMCQLTGEQSAFRGFLRFIREIYTGISYNYNFTTITILTLPLIETSDQPTDQTAKGEGIKNE